MACHSLQAVALAALEMATSFMKRYVRMSICDTFTIVYDQGTHTHAQLSIKLTGFWVCLEKLIFYQ